MDQQTLAELLAVIYGNRQPSTFTRDPGALQSAIGGAAGNFPGASLGPFHFMPGPMQPQHPWLGAIGEFAGNKRVRDYFAELMKKAGRGIGSVFGISKAPGGGDYWGT